MYILVIAYLFRHGYSAEYDLKVCKKYTRLGKICFSKPSILNFVAFS